jgi:transposase
MFTVEEFEQLKAANENLCGKVDLLERENRILGDKIKYLLKQLFGSKSEKIDPGQLTLLLEAQEQAAAEAEEIEEAQEMAPARRAAKRRPLSQRISDDLPVETVVIEPEEVLAHPEAYKRIGEETTVELDVVAAKFFRRVIIRPKYVRIEDRSLPPVVAPAPKRIIENSFASVGLLVAILLAKYVDHLPLYRQDSTFKGVLQTDAYAGFGAFYGKPGNAKLREGVERAGCWAHVRRKF